MVNESLNIERVNWKDLHLMTPEGVKKWGVDTEAPELFSPTLNGALSCRGCGHPYKPLVYKPGIIKPDQFCNQDCGIYFFNGRTEDFNRYMGVRGSWVAILEPLGQVYGEDSAMDRRAEAVLVTQVAGVCNSGKHHLLDKGVLLPSFRPNLLIPFCEDHLFRDRAVLSFRATETGLVFGPIEPPRKYFL